MKRKEQELARKLRHEGRSIIEIAASLGVAKSSVSLWVRNLEISKRAQEKIASLQTNGQKAARVAKIKRTSEKLNNSRLEATKLLSTVSTDQNICLIVCALLYWCEGEKSINDTQLTFSNSDPLIIGAFMSCFRRAILVEESKLRVRMQLHEYHKESTQRAFWSEVTGVPETQFSRTFVKPHTGHNIHKGYPGCVHIRYYDVRIARKIAATAREFLKNMIACSP